MDGILADNNHNSTTHGDRAEKVKQNFAYAHTVSWLIFQDYWLAFFALLPSAFLYSSGFVFGCGISKSSFPYMNPLR